jgi:hypothetical protein
MFSLITSRLTSALPPRWSRLVTLSIFSGAMPVWSSGRLPDGSHEQDEGLLGMGNDVCGVYVGYNKQPTNPVDRALKELDDDGEVLPGEDLTTPRTRNAIHDVAKFAREHEQARWQLIKQHTIG